jgi:hypothetical protein
MKTIEFKLLNIALLILLLCIVYLNLTAKPTDEFQPSKNASTEQQVNTHTLALQNN